MGVFSSARERRLWLWTAGVLATIWATLGLAGSVAGMLRVQDLLVPAFVGGVLLVAATVLTQGLQARPRGVEVAVVLGVAAAFVMVLVRMGIAEERTHLIEYGIVGVFVYEALRERAQQGRRVPATPVLAAAIAGAFGVIDECIQAILPARVFDPLDILVNVIAGTGAIVASMTLGWVRGRLAKG